MSTPRKRVLYIDHSFHKKTTSTQFMLEAFQRVSDVDEYWDDSWQGGERFDPRKYDKPEPDLVVLFQTEPSPELFRYWRCPIVAIPMLDSPYSWLTDINLRLTKSNVITFSELQHKKYIGLGLEPILLRYAAQVTSCRTIVDSGLRIYLWERGPVRWVHVKQLIGEQPVVQIYMKLEPDPGCESSEISPEDIEKYHIRFVEKWGSREDYWDLLNQCNVYIAPRVTEGIGMSFLEAMAMGVAVAAADKPTMNEYISHGVNGYLFNMSNLQPLDFSDAAAVGQRGRDSISALEKQFQDELMSAVTKVLSATNAKRTILVPLMAMGAQLRSNRKLRLAYRKIRYLSVKN